MQEANVCVYAINPRLRIKALLSLHFCSGNQTGFSGMKTVYKHACCSGLDNSALKLQYFLENPRRSGITSTLPGNFPASPRLRSCYFDLTTSGHSHSIRLPSLIRETPLFNPTDKQRLLPLSPPLRSPTAGSNCGIRLSPIL